MYKNILLIDDDRDDQELFLEAVGIISSTAICITLGDATIALQKLTAREFTPDAIFLDLNMPVMNGQQFLTAIKQTESIKDIPVIIISTTSWIETINETKALGALHFITKPIAFKDLVKVLEPLIG